MVKIIAIGDPHGSLDKIKKIPFKKFNPDLILVTGDLGSVDFARKFYFENVKRVEKGLPKKEYSDDLKKKLYMEYYNSSLKVIKYLSEIAPVYLIYGNADYVNSDIKKISKEIKKNLPLLGKGLRKIKHVRIVNNKIVNFKGISIGGLQYFVDASWIKEFNVKDKELKKKSKKEMKEIKKVLRNFDNVDILVCHQPPYGILDKVNFSSAPKHWKGKHAGSKIILDYVKKKQPEYVFCGHIHEGEGMKKVGKTCVYNLGVAGHKFVEFD